MKPIFLLAGAVLALSMTAPIASAQSLDPASQVEPRLKGAPTTADREAARSQARIVRITPRNDAGVVRVFRGSGTVAAPIAKAYPTRPVEYDRASQARIIRIAPRTRTRYGTVVVHAPQAFRPAKPE